MDAVRQSRPRGITRSPILTHADIATKTGIPFAVLKTARGVFLSGHADLIAAMESGEISPHVARVILRYPRRDWARGLALARSTSPRDLLRGFSALMAGRSLERRKPKRAVRDVVRRALDGAEITLGVLARAVEDVERIDPDWFGNVRELHRLLRRITLTLKRRQS